VPAPVVGRWKSPLSPATGSPPAPRGCPARPPTPPPATHPQRQAPTGTPMAQGLSLCLAQYKARVSGHPCKLSYKLGSSVWVNHTSPYKLGYVGHPHNGSRPGTVHAGCAPGTDPVECLQGLAGIVQEQAAVQRGQAPRSGQIQQGRRRGALHVRSASTPPLHHRPQHRQHAGGASAGRAPPLRRHQRELAKLPRHSQGEARGFRVRASVLHACLGRSPALQVCTVYMHVQ